MLKSLIYLLLFLTIINDSCAQSIITTAPANLNHSIANMLTIYEDSSGNSTIEDLLHGRYNYAGREIKNSRENLDFTTSSWHSNFIIDNTHGKAIQLFIEVARPITNEVNLYEYHHSGTLLTSKKSGDALPFEDKIYAHQKSLIPIYLKSGEKKNFWLELKSDGEIISLPFILWDESTFEKSNQKEQLFLGFTYGILAFVFLIYFVFFLLLKDRTFLYFIFYVLASGLLQFSLDGFTHQFIFTSGGYLTQHIVLLIAGTTVLFVLLFAKNYLKLSQRANKLNRLFKYSIILIGLVTISSLIPGKIYVVTYPLVNVFSLLSVLLILVSILYLRKKKYNVDFFFSLGFVILISSAIVFILGNFSIINAPALTENILKVGTIIEIALLSISMANKYRDLQNEKEEAQKLLLEQLAEKNEFMANINIKLEQQVKERTHEVELQKEVLKEKNEDILASIKYAERIQKAVLPSLKKFKALLPNSFVLFKPRDIVSGDFFWIEEVLPINGNKIIVYAAGDCTGHGVPGALVHIVGQSFLKLGKFDESVNSPAEALDFLNRGILETFHSEYKEETIRDGMDIALCAIDQENRKLIFSGAKNPVYIIRNEALIEIKGDKRPIGAYDENNHIKFNNVEFELRDGDTIYSFSDGFPDQFGGPKGKKFMYGKFKKLLIEIQAKTMDQQREELEKSFRAWMGDIEQVDDVLVIGVKFSC
ncbi:MAG: 7TM diverse intracellular signaling domain-containing protein [Flavobacteriales bacterium]|nr:7TM diverse intracellular signaling domain-containing protein [Flavobacteriales bacterium]